MYGYRKGDWKLVFGRTLTSAWDQWYAPDFINEMGARNFLQRHPLYHIQSETRLDVIFDGFKNGVGSGETRTSTDDQDVGGTAGNVTTTLNDVVGTFTNVVINVTCDSSNTISMYPSCDFQNTPCLFNISGDPCEYNNVAASYPDIVADLVRDVNAYRNVSAPNRFRPATTYRHASPPIWRPWVKDADTTNDDKCSRGSSVTSSTVLTATMVTFGVGFGAMQVRHSRRGVGG